MNIGSVRARKGFLYTIMAGMVAVAGCAPRTQPVAEPVPTAEEVPAAGAVTIELVSVVGDGDAILVEASGAIQYTAFRLSDPPRLIVDLPGVNMEQVSDTIEVDNNFMTSITTSTYGEDEKTIGRIEIRLREGINHNVKSGEDSLLVDLSRDIYISDEAGAVEEEPLAMEEEEAALEVAEAEAAVEVPVIEEAAEEPVEVPVIEEVTSEEPLPAATRLIQVASAREDGTSVFTVIADGAIGSYNSFGLDDPARLVIDVWGVDATIEQKDIPVSGEQIERIRVGIHPDKVRLVFDSRLPTVPAHTMRRERDRLVVRFGDEADLQAAEAAPVQVAAVEEEAPAPAEAIEEPPAEAAVESPAEVAVESPAEVEPMLIESVDFKTVGNKARIAIMSSGEPNYMVKESLDGKTVTVSIRDAIIPEELKRTLDATALATPVARISSYQASVEPSREVRILISLKEQASYEVTGEGTELNIDFPLAAPVAMAGETAMVTATGLEVAPAEEGETVSSGEFTGTRIDLDLSDAEVADILKLLAEVSNLNIIASDEVSGKITLRLKDVPWDQAFDLILKSKGLGEVREGNVIRVAPMESIKREKEAALAAKIAAQKLESIETEYVRVSYDEAATLAPQVQELLSDRGIATFHEATNTLVIKDTRKGIDEALDYISRVDIPTPQVLIEARIVEAESSFARDLGIQWGIDYQGGGPKVHTGIFGSSEQLGSFEMDPAAQTAIVDDAAEGVHNLTRKDWPVIAGVGNYAVNLPATGTAGALGGLGFVLGKAGASNAILDLRITAGEQEGVVKTISRPRITTLDNKEAKIEQGESIPFETTSASGTATSFIDANLSLTVTPHITPDGSVLMSIKASRNSIGTYRTSGGEPSINKKEAYTEVLVRDGETTVIGGIVITDTSSTTSGIPFLKDIPILGWLFKSKSVSDSQKELLIFITPTIITGLDKG
ncbi:MAG: type IV pilus secretin PilQ [Thermodesulfobacteriota bacterium]